MVKIGPLYGFLLCELCMQRLYTGGEGFTQLQTNWLLIKFLKVSIEVTSLIYIAWQVVPNFMKGAAQRRTCKYQFLQMVLINC